MRVLQRRSPKLYDDLVDFAGKVERHLVVADYRREYFYGFLGGDAHQFRPAIFENTTPLDPYLGRMDDYILDKDLADRAIKWIRTQKAVNPKKPFARFGKRLSCNAHWDQCQAMQCNIPLLCVTRPSRG